MSRLADRASWELLTDRLSRARGHLEALRQAIVTSRRYPGDHDRLCGTFATAEPLHRRAPTVAPSRCARAGRNNPHSCI